jgi:nitrate reductase NapE component
MTTSGIKPVMDQAVTLYGTLKVGAMRENGYLVGIYQMDGMTIDGPPGS